ncbi:unnamed protein product [Trypanosoma congolense IL3000]|uniref:WGS project CAEQ00000000 data, annotated contig 2212 n=1 Tax=Trypanosoma congolense (strain IL3000) TaxID=1068625 RepID=F9WCC1_TRYCI|nr:unnamed protein product [Trypanosoma congolense IL3000]
MRHSDVLQALMVRLVDPEKEDHDWLLISSVFYSLTKLLLPAPRVRQLYYSYLQAYGSRPAMEAACVVFAQQLSEKLQRSINSTAAPTVTGICRTGVNSSPMTAEISTAGAALSSGNCELVGMTRAAVQSRSPVQDEAVWSDSGFWEPGVAASKLTPEQRERWRRLRHEPISPDILVELLQRFTLVDGAAVFLAPVSSSTVMEFNGVRSGPYATIIHRPLSLLCIKRRVLAARRNYEMHKHQANMYPQATPIGGPSDPRRHAHNSDAVPLEIQTAGKKNNFRPPGADADDNQAIRTLQELEQAIWHITANCVTFNAPESYYPFMARKFALACVGIIDEYSLQCVSSPCSAALHSS